MTREQYDDLKSELQNMMGDGWRDDRLMDWLSDLLAAVKPEVAA